MKKTLRKTRSVQPKLPAQSISKGVGTGASQGMQLKQDFLKLLFEANPKLKTQTGSARVFASRLARFANEWGTNPENIDVYEKQLNDWIEKNVSYPTVKQDKEIGDLSDLLEILMGNVVELEKQLALHRTRIPIDLRKRLIETNDSITSVKESISAIQQKNE